MIYNILIKMKQKLWQYKKAKYKYKRLIKGPYYKKR